MEKGNPLGPHKGRNGKRKNSERKGGLLLGVSELTKRSKKQEGKITGKVIKIDSKRTRSRVGHLAWSHN